MEIIVVQSKKGLGKAGSVVKVKDGYARNYLLPNNIAICANKHNKEKFLKMREKIANENQKIWEKANEMAEKIRGIMIPITRQIGSNDKLYGSVLVRDVVTALKEMGYEIPKDTVSIKYPIKVAGVHIVDIDLCYDVSVKIYVSVGRSEEEAKNLFDIFLKSQKSEGEKEKKKSKSDSTEKEQIKTKEDEKNTQEEVEDMSFESEQDDQEIEEKIKDGEK